jgi:hypothetical protein
MDFINPYKMMQNPDLYERVGISQYNHSPFAYTFPSLFVLLFSPNVALLVFLVVCIALFLYFCYSNLKCASSVCTFRNVFVFSFLSYPVLFAVDRANDEFLVFIFLFLFVDLFRQGRFLTSVLPLSLAIAMKPFPAVFLVLLLAAKRYREVVYTILLAVGLDLFSLMAIGSGLVHNFNRWLLALNQYQWIYVINNEGLAFGHSLWGGFKFLFGRFYNNLDPNVMAGYLKPYTILCLLFFAFVAWFVVFRERVLWKRVALLVFCMNLLPYVSGDYKLLHIFIPLFLFINCKKKEKADVIYAVVFALLLIPKAYYHPYLTTLNQNAASISVLLNPLFMLIMSLAIIWEGLGTKSNARRRNTPKSWN